VLLLALPLAAVVPLATLVQSLKERFWGAALFARYRADLAATPPPEVEAQEATAPALGLEARA